MSVTQLTSEDADDAFPASSPDGKLIAFSSTRSGNWNIYVMDADGRNVSQITSGPSQDLHPTFSPDGMRLVYCSMGARASQWELWTVNLRTNEKKMVGVGLFPSWSPDREKDVITFQRARQRGSRWFSLWTMQLIEGEARLVTEVAVSGNAALVSPCWSPDGKRLAFSTIVSPSHMDGRKPQGQQDIWTVNADGTNRHRLTDGNGVNASPCWGSDGRVYFISDRGGTECVWSTPANTIGTALAGVGSSIGTAPSAAMQPQLRAKPPAARPSIPPSAVGSTDDTEIGH
jgi:Tol biopolymer transport system component